MKYLDFLSRVQIGSCWFERERNGNSVHLLKRANTGDSFPLRFIEIGWSFRSITMRHARIELSPLWRHGIFHDDWGRVSASRPSFDPRRSDWKVITRPIPRKDTFEINSKTGRGRFHADTSTITTPIRSLAMIRRGLITRAIRLKQNYTTTTWNTRTSRIGRW